MTQEDQINEALMFAEGSIDELVAAAKYLADNFDMDPDEAYFIVRGL